MLDSGLQAIPCASGGGGGVGPPFTNFIFLMRTTFLMWGFLKPWGTLILRHAVWVIVMEKGKLYLL